MNHLIMLVSGLTGAVIGGVFGGVVGLRGGWLVGHRLVCLGNAPEH